MKELAELGSADSLYAMDSVRKRTETQRNRETPATLCLCVQLFGMVRYFTGIWMIDSHFSGSS